MLEKVPGKISWREWHLSSVKEPVGIRQMRGVGVAEAFSEGKAAASRREKYKWRTISSLSWRGTKYKAESGGEIEKSEEAGSRMALYALLKNLNFILHVLGTPGQLHGQMRVYGHHVHRVEDRFEWKH